jgi:signal transduction histidine kinase
VVCTSSHARAHVSHTLKSGLGGLDWCLADGGLEGELHYLSSLLRVPLGTREYVQNLDAHPYDRVPFRQEPDEKENEGKTKASARKKMTMMTTTAIHEVWRSAVLGLLGAIGLALVTFSCFRLQVGLAAAALLYLMVVVLVSLKGSFVSSTVVSVFAVGSLDYFFTTPLFTLGMNDFRSYVAMIVFLTTSLIITRLVSRVRKQAEEALSSVSHEVIKAEEQERHRIAADLHEDIGQRLTLLALGIERLKTDTLDPSVDVPSHMDALWKQTLEILTDVKALAHELYSPRLEYLGVAAVMSSFCKEFGERKRVGIDFRSDGLPSAISPEISLCLFRVLQEALHNAVQHSGVRQVDTRLWGTSDQIQLTVRAFGVGFNPGTAREAGGLGLNRIQERLQLVKGNLSIDSQPKRGTTICARVPLSLGSDSMRLVMQSS